MARLLPTLLAAAILGVWLGRLLMVETPEQGAAPNRDGASDLLAEAVTDANCPLNEQGNVAPVKPGPSEAGAPTAKLILVERTAKSSGLSKVICEPVAPPDRVDFTVAATVEEGSGRGGYAPVEASPPASLIRQPPPPPMLASPGTNTFGADGPPAGAFAQRGRSATVADSTPVRNPPLLRAAAGEDPLRAVLVQAAQMSDLGFAMAQRGMSHAGCGELVKSLELVVQGLDARDGSGAHAVALASGLTALIEARDFVASGGRQGEIHVTELVRKHQTPVLKRLNAESSPAIAQQQYYGYAQSQFVAAAGGLPVASKALYRLGRIQAALSNQDGSPERAHLPQAIVYHQAALAADGTNALAANELGVLYARLGQLSESRQFLLYSVTLSPQREAWHNLAVVHHLLGEPDLAKRAEYERDLDLASSSWPKTPTASSAGPASQRR